MKTTLKIADRVRANAALAAGWSYGKIAARYGADAARYAYLCAHPVNTGHRYWSRTHRRFISSRA